MQINRELLSVMEKARAMKVSPKVGKTIFDEVKSTVSANPRGFP